MDKNNVLANAMQQAVSESLENMVFMAVEPMKLVWAKVDVLAPFDGSVSVAFPERLLKEVATEIYGEMGKGGSESVMRDAIAEVTNVIAGRIMNFLVSSEEEFQLGLPETGFGQLDCDTGIFFTQHYELNGAMYVVMVEGQDFMKFKNQVVKLEDPLLNDDWGF
ncbi:MAG: hypothetical protein EOL87_11175 [Spartobacteria bacterium]|nr:hypothetical protein [Spartobacteria bacterium]